MVEPLPMGAFDPLEDSDDDNDFQIQRQLLNQRLTTAIGGLTALQQISVNGPNANSNQGRGRKRKRGPPAKKVSHIWYCLAEGATVPNLKKNESCPIHQAQTEAGYGYPPSCVSQEGISMVQLELELDEVQFKEEIWELFPILRRSPFNIYKRDKQKKLVLINVKTPKELKNERYRSTIFIRPSSAFHSALAPASTSATTAALAPASTSATTSALAPASTSATTAALAPASTSATTSALARASTSASTAALAPASTSATSSALAPASTSATTSSATTSVPTTPFIDDSNNFSPLGVSGDLQRRRLIVPQFEPTSRTRLRLEQDMAFDLSLRADRQRAADQQQEREMRQRRRQQRIEEMNKMLEEIGPEPTDGFRITFRLPDGNRVTRKFDENAPLRVLFLFVECKFCIRISKLFGPAGVVLAKSELPLHESVDASSIVTVESESDAISDDDISDNEPDVEPEASKLDMPELERRRKQAFLYLCNAKKITVDRKNILETVLNAYRGNLELEHHKLEVELANEMGLDLDGVTKEMFHLFFSAFAEKYMEGDLQKVPSNDHRYHSTDLYRTLGRIIVHAYVLSGYWPVQVNRATLTAALTASVSEEAMLASFFDIMTERERELLKRLLRGESNPDEHLRILGVLARFDCRQQISTGNARSVLSSLAGAVTVYRPYHAILQIGQGMSSYNNMWEGMQEENIQNLYNRATPDPSGISDTIEPLFSSDNDQRTMEERVIIYLEAWMATLLQKELMMFLVYWTASNVCLPDQSLRVGFNSSQGLARRPTATTCTNTLTLSRYYFSQEDFDTDMKIVFSTEAKVMDAL